MNINEYVLLTGSANLKLAKAIASYLKKPVFETVSRFADGEESVIIPENLRRREVYIIQPTTPAVDSHIMELLFIIDAARRASAREIIAVVPYFGYSRQDRKDKPRVPISASLIAGMIEYAGASRIVTLDIHSEQEQGFTKIPWDNLYGSYVLIPVLKRIFKKDLIVASPDKGGVPKATFYAHKLDAEGVAIVFKERDVHRKNISVAIDMVGEVKGKNVLLVDDMIDTAGTICAAADLIKQRGAKSVRAAATHGLFSGPALDRITQCALREVFVTDTVLLREEVLKHPKIRVVPVAPFIAEAIKCINSGDSLSRKLIP